MKSSEQIRSGTDFLDRHVREFYLATEGAIEARTGLMRRILIQSSATGLFLGDGHGWTANACDAQNFGTSLNAVAHCLQANIPDAQVVIRFEEPKAPDVMVPVSQPVQN